MIRTVLIDDEKPALRELQYYLGEYDSIQIVGLFTNPFEAIENIANFKPKIVILDINMPQLNGIQIATKILELYPETSIIFVTAYREYAFEAVNIKALDYILKPISKEKFEKTVDKLKHKFV